MCAGGKGAAWQMVCVGLPDSATDPDECDNPEPTLLLGGEGMYTADWSRKTRATLDPG